MSKGWGRRPAFVDRADYDASFDRIFSKNPSSATDSHPNENGVVAGVSLVAVSQNAGKHSEPTNSN